ncbi:TetR/AcrR family transcriptional regulator [Pseudomonas shahriarae]|uniref:TetR/AcrR family transcriptional regulator n=1 Tax=Pseudomonas shahriarae TaxID=2745512 RepID=UPI002360090E|nr:TetR/AcrR family transcriptional regulator [Pseudomonas shahriarae]MDD1035207.1 TetR/AcrR family transcriptional regulator [Pseudomonas shahriarae]
MRYSVSHKQQTRDKLLHSSAALAKKEGFASVGVDGLMKAIGLSGGAFFSHFSSKDALFSSIVEHELSQSLERLSVGEVQSRERLQRCLKFYLSMAHVEQVQDGCALPSMGAEIARADIAVRQHAQEWICRLQANWARTLESESLAWAILSQCVGALVVARMMVDPQVQAQVLASSYEELSQRISQE